MSTRRTIDQENIELRIRLREARQSLRRAWYGLQVFRIWLEEVGRIKLPPVGECRSIGAEVRVLRKALEELISREITQFDAIVTAIQRYREHAKGADDQFPYHHLALNRALDLPSRPSLGVRSDDIQRAQERIEKLGSPPA